jgi:cytochrome c-type biogenesis protein CcmF
MMVGSFAAVAVGVILRRNQLASDSDGFERIVSKEGSYYFNNVIMLIAAVLVAYFTLAPSLPSWLPLGGQTFKAPAYDALARPLGIFYILVMTVCPILAWGGGDWRKLWERAKIPVIAGTVLAAGGIAVFATSMLPYYVASADVPTWWHHFLAIAGIVTAAYAIALPLYLFVDGTRKRAAAKGEGVGSAFWWVMTKARTQSGGYLTHLGMGIILLGLVGSTMFVKTYPAVLPQEAGAVYEAEGYTFAFNAIETRQANVQASGAYDERYVLLLDVSKGGRFIRTMEPNITLPQQLRQENQTTQHVALLTEPLKDVFVSFSGVDQSDNVNLTIKFFPMQIWVWVGFVVTILGAGLASWPKKQPAAA